MIFLVGGVFAGIGKSNINKDITLSKERTIALTSMNLNNYTVSDYDIGLDYKERCLYKPNAINKCNRFKTYYMNCSIPDVSTFGCDVDEVRIDYTSQEMTTILNDWEKETIESIADIKIKRDTINSPTKTGEGITTVKEKNK